MRKLLALLLLPFTASAADEVRIAVGMSHAEAITIIEKHGAVDITLGAVVVGEKPQSKSYWEFRDYDAIIKFTTNDAKVVGMSFWRKKDFDSASHRAQGVQIITALKLDTKKKEVSIEKKKEAG